MRRHTATDRASRTLRILLGWLLLASGCSESEVAAPRSKSPAGGLPAAFSATATPGDPSKGRSIWVRVLDRNAVPIAATDVFARVAADQVVAGVPIRPGEHRIDGITSERVEIWVDVAGKRHGMNHPVSNARATLVVPEGGRLDVVWSLPQLEALPVGTLHLVISAVEDPEVRFELDLERDPSHQGKVEIPYMLPGEYLAGIELWRVPEGEVAKYDPAKVLPLITPRLLYIAAGEATRIVLGTPVRASKDAGNPSP